MGKRGHIWPRKGSDQFYATIGGQQVPLGSDRDAAEREYHRRKAEHGKAVAAGITLGGLCDIYMDFVERECEPATVEQYTYTLKKFVAHVGSTTPAADVRPKDVSAWIADHPRWGATTRNIVITLVKGLYAWGRREGHLSADPLAELAKPGRKRREKIVTESQVPAIMAAIRAPEFRDFVVALRETGCRPIEVYTLTVDRVDLDAGTWLVRNKTRRSTGEPWRTVYLSARMIAMSRGLMEVNPTGELFRNTQGAPWTHKNIRKRFERIREKTGMGGETVAYSFRHLYITDALERGIPPATVAELVGHKSLDMIMRIYNKLKLRTGHLREAAQAIRPGPEPTTGA